MLLTSSTGPNGVLTECQLKYGENRINLLYILMLKQHPNQQLEYYLVILNDITLIL